MSEHEIAGVNIAALLHDIGKLAVPEHILAKPGAVDLGRIPEGSHSSAGGRRDHPRRAVSLSCRAAHQEPS
jgi:hypothetical protein